MITRLSVAALAVLVVIYIILIGQRAWLFATSGTAVGVGIGILLLVFPLLAVWLLSREIVFGARATALGRRLDATDDEWGVATRPSGRPDRDSARAEIAQYRARAEADPGSWQAWYRLGLVYDAAGDRRHAREVIRRAIRLERS